MLCGGGVGMYLKDENDSCDIILLFKMNVEGMVVKLRQENILLLFVYCFFMMKLIIFIYNFRKVFDFLKINY